MPSRILTTVLTFPQCKKKARVGPRNLSDLVGTEDITGHSCSQLMGFKEQQLTSGQVQSQQVSEQTLHVPWLLGLWVLKNSSLVRFKLTTLMSAPATQPSTLACVLEVYMVAASESCCAQVMRTSQDRRSSQMILFGEVVQQLSLARQCKRMQV